MEDDLPVKFDGETLPPFPKPLIYDDQDGYPRIPRAFSAQQMIDYAIAAVKAEREACALIGDGFDYGSRNCGDEIRARNT